MKKSFKSICSILLTSLVISNPCHALLISKKTVAKILVSGATAIGISAVVIYGLNKVFKTNPAPSTPNNENASPKTNKKSPTKKVPFSPSKTNKSTKVSPGKSRTNLPEKRNLNDFNNKERAWIKFLSGEVLTPEEKAKYNFVYSSCEEFLQDNDENLESRHNYIQVVFPNIIKSVFSNTDLYIQGKENLWKNILSNESTKKNIQETMRRNYNRILNFWDNKSLGSNDHNILRMTRVLISLKLFGLQEEYENLKRYLINRFGEEESFSKSFEYWQATENTASLV